MFAVSKRARVSFEKVNDSAEVHLNPEKATVVA
jgi:hypothetical protein